jgi:phenylalanyl-tRNA synthetase beta chain
MIVSWNWLQDYVKPGVDVEAMADLMTMSGFNLESINTVGTDAAIDFEITSNRRDCLGHIGIAREIAVLFQTPLTIPPSRIPRGTTPVTSAVTVENECPDLCPHYTARVIRGVKVGPSPAWLVERLATIGLGTINNIVDVTNYVMMECGQPLHAFDLDKLHGQKIIVRRAKAGEKITSIKHTECKLTPDMCVIADAEKPVAIAGVMGGLETEITEKTQNVLIEVADFSPISIRTTARQLALPSDSSYRFGRSVDKQQLDWVSSRCCELILQLAGGELLEGLLAVPAIPDYKPQPVTIRWHQVERILGVNIPVEKSRQILLDLGLEPFADSADANLQMTFVPPSWRNDLEREADLIEEIARHYGYDKIPENVAPQVVSSVATKWQLTVDRIHQVLIANGFFEAYTLSFVTRPVFEIYQAIGAREPMTVDHSTRRQENIIRQSLIPSLLSSRRENEKRGTFDADLYEISRVFLDDSPQGEPYQLGIVSGRALLELKGVVESILQRLQIIEGIEYVPSSRAEFIPGRGIDLKYQGVCIGYIGEMDRKKTDILDLREAVTVAEISLDPLVHQTVLLGSSQVLSPYPSIARDINFVLDEAVTWAALSDVVKMSAGPLLENLTFDSQYRSKQLGSDKKSYLIKLFYRAADRTLTSEEVEDSVQQVIAACKEKLQAELRA